MKKTFLFLILIIIMAIYRPIISYFLPDLDADYSTLLRKGIQAGTILIFITFNKMWNRVGNLTKISGDSLTLILPVLLLSLTTYLYGFKDMKLFDFMLTVFITLLIGLIEELEFRGVIYSYLEESGSNAILVSSVLFGLIHLLNLAYQPDLLGVAIQCIFAMGFGLVMAAVRYRTGLLLPQILIHALWDLNQRVTLNNTESLLVDVIYYSSLALVFAWGLYLFFTLKSHFEVRKEKYK